MSRLAEDRRAPVLTLAGALAVLVASHVLWLALVRRGYPLNVDEAGYLGIAFDFTEAVRDGALRTAWESQRSQAPLVPLLTAPVGLVRMAIIPSYAVLIGFFVLLTLATYGVARRLVSPWWAVLAALVVATLPAVTDLTRTYIFAVPAAALTMSAIYALGRSDHLRHRRWAIAFGALIGLMVLSRTMNISYVPGLVTAAVVVLAAAPSGRRRGAVNLALGALAGLFVAWTWYRTSWDTVLAYLRDAGYGDRSAEFSSGETGWGSSERWLADIRNVVQNDLYVPMTVLLAAGLAAALAALVRRLRALGGTGERVQALARSPALVPAVVALEGYLAIVSSTNAGYAFALPLLAPIVVVAVAGLARLPAGPARTGLAVALAGVSAFNVLAKSDAIGPLAQPVHADVPLTEVSTISDGNGDIHDQMRGASGLHIDPAHALPAQLKGWEGVNRDAAAWLEAYAHQHGRGPVVFLASRDPLFSTNTIGLQGRLLLHTSIAFGQLEPRDGPAAAGYRAALADAERGQPNLLVLGERSPGEFRPYVDQGVAAAAARSLGFRPVHTFTLPDGRRAPVLWLDRGPAL